MSESEYNNNNKILNGINDRGLKGFKETKRRMRILITEIQKTLTNTQVPDKQHIINSTCLGQYVIQAFKTIQHTSPKESLTDILTRMIREDNGLFINTRAHDIRMQNIYTINQGNNTEKFRATETTTYT